MDSRDDIEDIVYHHFMNGFEDGLDSTPGATESVGGSQHLTLQPGKRLRLVEDAIPYMDMEKALADLECDRTDAAVFVNYDTFILYGISNPLCPAFQYKFEVVEDKNSKFMKAGRKVVFLSGFGLGGMEAIPLPPHPPHVLTLIEWAFLNKRSDSAKKLREALCEWIHGMPKKEKITYDAIVDFIMSVKSSYIEIFTENPRIKQFFLYPRLKLMEKYYKLEDVSALPSLMIQELSMYFDPESPTFPDPIDLAFHHTARRFRSTDRSGAPLPELSAEQWEYLCKLRQIPVDPVLRRAISLYDTIKREIRESGNKYVYESDKEALEKLVDLGAMKLEISASDSTTRRYYLRRIYIVEELILHSFERLIDNFARGVRPSTLHEPSPTSILTSVIPCSEQLKMMNRIKNQPITLVDGMGGAGKTDGCSMSFRYVKSEEGLFLTFQSVNAANARTRVTSHSFTIHKLMVLHAKFCWRSPYWRPHPDASKQDPYPVRSEIGLEFCKCPFESVRYAVLDEGGILYDELFAQIFYAMVTCGQLCRVVMCGDVNQQGQMREGQLFRDLLYGLPEWSMKFVHCHRFTDEAALLFHNNALAIYAQDLSRFKFDPERTKNIFHSIPDDLDPALVRRHGREEHGARMGALREVLVQAFRKYDIGDQENVLIIARTHEIRKLVVDIVKDLYHRTDANGFVMRQKITYTRTDYDIQPNLYHNEILMIDEIQDVRIDISQLGKKKDSEKETDQMVVDATQVVQTVYSSVAKRIKDNAVFRRFLCHVRGVPSELRVIPWYGKHRTCVMPATAITERSSQGLEADIVVSIKPGAWEKADTYKSMGMVETRARKKMIWISPKSVLQKWIMTREAIRRSALCEKLYNLMLPHMEAHPAPADTDTIKKKLEEETGMYQ
jgi:hypothetical protein